MHARGIVHTKIHKKNVLLTAFFLGRLACVVSSMRYEFYISGHVGTTR